MPKIRSHFIHKPAAAIANGALLAVALSFLPGRAMAQPSRVTSVIDNSRRVALNGHVHPLARPEFDRGAVDPSTALTSLAIQLKSSASQQSDLTRLLAEQQDPSSPNYHRWLTPEQYADRFGLSSGDLDQIKAWLVQQNLKVTGVARARNWISFSGTVGQVEQAFQTQIHQFNVNGQMHIANVADPSIPEALAVVVSGIRGLNDFRMRSLSKRRGAAPAAARPLYTDTMGDHYLSPDDFHTIYDMDPLLNAGINGSGQSLVIAGQTQINVSDIESFRSMFNLPANDPQIILVPDGGNPGISQSDLGEADLDIELSGAAAPNATVIFVYAEDVMTAVQYAIDQNYAPVLSTSYGNCEQETPRSEALMFQSWAEQGNAQGITWIGAAGDSGGADCLDGASTDDGGPAVDTPASVPQVTAMGGSEFNEGTGQYWNPTNNANGGSVLSYIPEMVWNDSTPGNPEAGGGGASIYFPKPSWQTGAGVPSDGVRDVPDLSLTASANHDGFLVYTGGSLQIYGGTSVAAPSFAGIATLLNQYLVSKGVQSTAGLGNINPKLYSLAQSVPAAFHDITQGNNIVVVNCTARSRDCTSGSWGFDAGPGYDQASGLGSVDVNNLVMAWAGQGTAITKTTPALTLSDSAASILSSGTISLTATITSSSGSTPSGSVAFNLGSVSLGSTTLSGANDTATATLTVSGGELPLGSDTITAQYSGNSVYNIATASIAINVSSSSSAPPSIAALTNGASFRQGFAPGMILTVFGAGLAPSTWSASNVPLPDQLAGVSVTIDGIAAPLYYASPSQLNIQVPYGISAGLRVPLVVSNNGQTASATFSLNSAAPGIFTDQTGALVPVKSAAPGQVISLYMTGAGAVTPSITTGAAPATGTAVISLPVPVQGAQVTIGSENAPIQFIGIPVGLVGVVQINFLVPSTAATGPQSVFVSIGGVPSVPATLTITP
jgi:uncharacterized protein (TIGR03437 family)